MNNPKSISQNLDKPFKFTENADKIKTNIE